MLIQPNMPASVNDSIDESMTFPVWVDGEYISLKEQGAKANGKDDDTKTFQKAIDRTGGTVFINDGTYIIKQSLIIDHPIQIIGGGNATIIADGDFPLFIIKSSHVRMKNFTQIKKVQNFAAANASGVLMASQNANGTYNYLHDIILSDIVYRNFTTSIELESIYWLRLENLHTYHDKFGITSNLKTNAVDKFVNATTTFYFDRVYLHGGDGDGIDTGSKGVNIKNAVNLLMTGCVIEWYDFAGNLDTIQTLSINDIYLEICNAGLDMIGITGTAYINNPYFNLVKQWTFRIWYGNFIFNGGRGIINPPDAFCDKLWESTYTEYAQPAIEGGGAKFSDSLSGGWNDIGVTTFNAYTNTVMHQNAAWRSINHIDKKGAKLTPYGVEMIDPDGSYPFKIMHGSVNPFYTTKDGAFFNIGKTQNYLWSNPQDYDGQPLLVKADQNGGHDGVSDSLYISMKNRSGVSEWRLISPIMKTATPSTMPTATAASRGELLFVFGGTGVADGIYTCMKDAAENYSWVLIK